MNNGLVPHIPGLNIDEQIFIKKKEAFDKGIEKLQNEIGLVIVPVLQNSQFGILPSIIYMDKKAFDKIQQNTQTQDSAAKGIKAEPVK